MAKFALLGVATVLSIALVTPILAQPVLQDPSSYAFYHPRGDMEPAPFQRRDGVVVGHGTANATPLAPSFRPSVAGEETTTRPWSAPVGHRQPRAAEVPTSTSVSPYVLDQEDANVDRKIGGVCRGC
jgi:hypothetical protein